MAALVVHVAAWYSAMKGSFTDAEALYYRLLYTNSKGSGKNSRSTLLDLSY
ncbi:hypothetical protein E2C01_090102 [Portunus trituberculatus]|uniref:Uncharacterized protein n=1 Tax=Portunus trituberculatus TaxID=210409 RepID=A0A5B7JAK7_PORTR|nr:hypothetical protein [Portunus trituberculatus]